MHRNRPVPAITKLGDWRPRFVLSGRLAVPPVQSTRATPYRNRLLFGSSGFKRNPFLSFLRRHVPIQDMPRIFTGFIWFTDISSRMYNPEIFISKIGFMQRISDWVRVGYTHWASGTVSREKAAHLVRKFERNYFVAQDKNQRFKAKKVNEGCASLLLWASAPGVLTWILLLTAAEHPAHAAEKLKNALAPNGRISLTGYELARHTRGAAANPSWTWRMTAANYDAWRLRILHACRAGDALTLRQAIFSLYHTPGFAQCRSQVGKLMSLFRGEWKRTRASQVFPSVPNYLPYVRRFKASTIPLSTWLNAVDNQPEKSSPEE